MLGKDLIAATLFGSSGGSSVQPDWNQNDETAHDYVKNRTHYGSKGAYTWDGETFDSYVVVDAEHKSNATDYTRFCIVKISDELPTPEEVIGSNGKITVGNYRSKKWSDRTITVTEDNVKRYENGWCVGSYVIIAYAPGRFADVGNEIDYVDIAEPGVYFHYQQRTSSGLRCTGMNWDSLKTLDEKYIPDTIARKSDLEGLGGSGGVDIHILTIRTENDESTYSSNMTYDELRQKVLDATPLIGFIQSWSINQSPGLDSYYINTRGCIEKLNYGMSTEEGENIRISDYEYGDYYDIKPDGTIEYGQHD